MSVTIKSVSIAALLVALAACGSSSDTTAPVSRSGLPFATDNIAALIDGLTPGQALSVIVRTIQFDQPDLTETFRDELGVSFIPADGAALDSGTGTLVVTFEGEEETFAFVEGVADLGEGMSASLSQELIGVASALLGLEVNDPALIAEYDNSGGTDFKSYFVLGFETSQEDMVALAGSMGSSLYSGSFTGLGEITSVDGALPVEDANLSGSVSFDVSFANGNVDGSLTISQALATTDDFELIGNIGGPVTFNLDEGTMLEDNGFANGATGVDTGVSHSSINGVFYGVDAAELAGTASIDYTSAGGGTLVGVGGYIASQEDMILPMPE